VTLQINGATRELPTLGSVADLVKELALSPATILVEHNGVALRRDEWRAATLRENDKIEVLQIVAGG
jgi:sulfur carrier protein